MLSSQMQPRPDHCQAKASRSVCLLDRLSLTFVNSFQRKEDKHKEQKQKQVNVHVSPEELPSSSPMMPLIPGRDQEKEALTSPEGSHIVKKSEKECFLKKKKQLDDAAMVIERIDRLRDAFHCASAPQRLEDGQLLEDSQLIDMLEDGLFSQLIALMVDSESARSEAFVKHVSDPLLRALETLSTTSYSYPQCFENITADSVNSGLAKAMLLDIFNKPATQELGKLAGFFRKAADIQVNDEERQALAGKRGAVREELQEFLPSLITLDDFCTYRQLLLRISTLTSKESIGPPVSSFSQMLHMISVLIDLGECARNLTFVQSDSMQEFFKPLRRLRNDVFTHLDRRKLHLIFHPTDQEQKNLFSLVRAAQEHLRSALFEACSICLRSTCW